MSSTNGAVAAPVGDGVAVAHRGGGYDRVMESIPDPQVPQVAKRRSFTVEYKQRIVRLYDAASPAEKAVFTAPAALVTTRVSAPSSRSTRTG